MARIQCPNCASTNTWAHYIHDPCPSSATGKTEWDAEAESATPLGEPFPKPCPLPNDGTMCQAAYTKSLSVNRQASLKGDYRACNLQ